MGRRTTGRAVCVWLKEEDLPALSETIEGRYTIRLAPRVAQAADILEICRAAL